MLVFCGQRIKFLSGLFWLMKKRKMTLFKNPLSPDAKFIKDYEKLLTEFVKQDSKMK